MLIGLEEAERVRCAESRPCPTDSPQQPREPTKSTPLGKRRKMFWGRGQLPVGRCGRPRRRSRRGKAREQHAALPSASSHCQICDEFRSISRKIYEKPNSIEELAELREWMKGIPERLVGLEVRQAHGHWGQGGTGLVLRVRGLGQARTGRSGPRRLRVR